MIVVVFFAQIYHLFVFWRLNQIYYYVLDLFLNYRFLVVKNIFCKIFSIFLTILHCLQLHLHINMLCLLRIWVCLFLFAFLMHFVIIFVAVNIEMFNLFALIFVYIFLVSFFEFDFALAVLEEGLDSSGIQKPSFMDVRSEI